MPLPFVHGFCQGLAVALLVVLAIYANTAHAAERWNWRRVAVADEVAITVQVVSAVKLASLMHIADAHAFIDKGGRMSRHGYAELRRNVVTGAYVCTVYVTAENSSAETLEHESRHCHGWVHQ